MKKPRRTLWNAIHVTQSMTSLWMKGNTTSLIFVLFCFGCRRGRADIFGLIRQHSFKSCLLRGVLQANAPRIRENCFFLFSWWLQIAVFFYCIVHWLLSRFSIVRYHWIHSNVESRAVLKSHRTVHVPFGCYFTFQIPLFPRCIFYASNSLRATSFFVNANRLWLSLRNKSLICLQRLILCKTPSGVLLHWKEKSTCQLHRTTLIFIYLTCNIQDHQRMLTRQEVVVKPTLNVLAYEPSQGPFLESISLHHTVLYEAHLIISIWNVR